jgi:hypothetical protein
MTHLATCANGPAFCTPYSFTGKERDAESGNDYFNARYYASSMGRVAHPFVHPNPRVPHPSLFSSEGWVGRKLNFRFPKNLQRTQHLRSKILLR